MQYVRKLSKGDKVAVVSLLRDIVGNIPVDRSLLESDAPFTKGLSEKQTVNVNDLIYKYIDELYYQEIDVVKKRIKANFAELLKSSALVFGGTNGSNIIFVANDNGLYAK